MKLFVRAKHWQIFVLLVAFPAIVGFAFPDPSANLVPLLLDVGWYWSVGTFLNQIPRSEFRMGARLFNLGLLYPLVLVSVALILPGSAVPSDAVLLALLVIALLSAIYVTCFIAKALVTAESGRLVTFGDYVGPFFLLAVFPIGIWFLQPRINQLYEASLILETVPQPQE